MNILTGLAKQKSLQSFDLQAFTFFWYWNQWSRRERLLLNLSLLISSLCFF